MTNLAIWDKLGKTDPKHTKPFNRAGGFKGTAVKPVYTEHKMTEVFGPCGTGWGFTEPQFQTVPGSDGQVAVYCWLSLWYVEGGKRSELVPGVGGDMVVVKQSGGLRTDDEAFKKAFTDAIGNAMKHIGMSADVHMGRFDDSKYVDELKAEARRIDQPAPAPSMSYADQIQSANTVKGVDEVWERIKFLPDAEMPQPEFDRLYVIYQKRIQALKPIPKTLGDHLDNLEREAATNPH